MIAPRVRRCGQRTTLVSAGLLVVAAIGPVSAEPYGAVDLLGQRVVNDRAPGQRAGVAVTGYVTRRIGVRVAAQASLEPAGDVGGASLGLAYRAAAARPRLELVVRAEAGVVWPSVAPGLGGGVSAYLWPTRLPVAVVLDLGALAVLDGVDDSRLIASFGLGLSLAR